MKIETIFNGIEFSILQKGQYNEINRLCVNSKLIKAQNTFIAVKGTKHDGHDYIEEAINRGAVIIVGNTDKLQYLQLPEYITLIAVDDTRIWLSRMVNNYYEHPTEHFKLIGVTGTNGKTSVTTIANHVFTRLGYKTGLIGTIDNYIDNNALQIVKTNPTTPDCIELGEIMDSCVDKGVDYVLMEVTSMSLKMHRVRDCKFDIAVFNNISPEHLDDHKTLNDYKASKLMLFPLAKKAVVNMDDSFAGEVINACSGEYMRFGIDNPDKCDLFAKDIEFFNDKIEFKVVWNEEVTDFAIKTPSKFAIYNTLAVIGICLLSNLEITQIQSYLCEDIYIAGRYEILKGDDQATVIIDFAHTPVALDNILQAVRLNNSYKRIISVFGCGGDRDKSKRGVMGKISQENADYTIVTSDNPRTEAPERIIQDILEGMDKRIDNYKMISDRAAAIKEAISMARRNDVVVIAGKGHETEQILNGYTIEMDDKKIAASYLSEKAK